MTKMKKVELLAPAGDLTRLKVAMLYGADACFIGGLEFSLRARASNFTIEDIKEACLFAHNLNKKVYVTTNIIPHDEDLTDLVEYLKALDSVGVDAIIAASPVIIETALKETNLEVHLSTQQSVINSNTVNYWHNKGIERVVLGRELTSKEIGEITKNSKAEIEVFIHGGMCMSFSGRCSLSDNLTGRDANRGGCAHSCRWNYSMYENGQLLSDENFSMSSKDLQSLEHIPYLIDQGVDSFKIEGRMKSLHYIATVVSTYRQLIDDYSNGELKELNYYDQLLKKAENREMADGYMTGLPGVSHQLYDFKSETPIQNFVGIVLDYDHKNKKALIEQRNKFVVNDNIEILSPNEYTGNHFKLNNIYNEDHEVVLVANKVRQKLWLDVPYPLSPYDLLRVNK